MNRSVFVRVEVILKGATFHVIFSDAANFPPPFRLENLSQVPSYTGHIHTIMSVRFILCRYQFCSFRARSTILISTEL